MVSVAAERKRLGLPPFETVYKDKGIHITGLKTEMGWELHCIMDSHIKTNWGNRFNILRALPDDSYCYTDTKNTRLNNFLYRLGATMHFKKWVGVGRSIAVWTIKC